MQRFAKIPNFACKRYDIRHKLAETSHSLGHFAQYSCKIKKIIINQKIII